MTSIAKLSAIMSVCAMATSALPAMAALPDPVKAMLDKAIADGDTATLESAAKLVKATYPADSEEVDGILADYHAQRAAAEIAEKREAGILENWHGSGELGGYIATGNTSNKGVSAGLSLNKDGIDWRHKTRIQADYQRSDGDTTRNQLMGSYELNYQLSDHLYLFGLGMAEKDKFQGFSSRFTASGGLGYRVIDNDAMTLDVKGGPAWRRTDWIGEPTTKNVDALAGADFAWHISPMLDFTDNAQILIGSGNKTYSNTASLNAKLGGALSARLSYGWRRESNPPAGRKNTDTITRATLVYGF